AVYERELRDVIAMVAQAEQRLAEHDAIACPRGELVIREVPRLGGASRRGDRDGVAGDDGVAEQARIDGDSPWRAEALRLVQPLDQRTIAASARAAAIGHGAAHQAIGLI